MKNAKTRSRRSLVGEASAIGKGRPVVRLSGSTTPDTDFTPSLGERALVQARSLGSDQADTGSRTGRVSANGTGSPLPVDRAAATANVGAGLPTKPTTTGARFL